MSVVTLNSEQLNTRDKNFKEVFEKTLRQRGKKQCCLKNADEDVCLLLLESWVKLWPMHDDSESTRLREIIEFQGCRFDKRFFKFLSATWKGYFMLNLEFHFDCTINYKGLGELQEIMKSLCTLARISISLRPNRVEYTCYSSKTLQLPHMDIGDLCCTPAESPETNLGTFLHWTIPDSGGKDIAITDVPLLPYVLRLPNFDGISYRWKKYDEHYKEEFCRYAFNEFRKRPSYSIPCTFLYKPSGIPSMLSEEVLNRFNQDKMRHLKLDLLRSDDSAKITKLLEKALEVISQSVYLNYLEIDYEGSHMEHCRYFLQQLEKLVSRMRPFYLDTSNLFRLELLKIGSRIQSSWTNKQNKEGLSLMIMTFASSVSVKPLVPWCYLALLSTDILRGLRSFLF